MVRETRTMARDRLKNIKMFDWLRNIFRKDDNDKIKVRLELDNGKYYEELVDPDDFEKRIGELQEQFNPRKPLDQTTFIWCLVGNIIDEHYYGTDKEIKHGTKHFSPSTKVYCFPMNWGDAYEKIKVIGRHRKTIGNICIVMPSKYITNWRLQKVHRPNVLKLMHSQDGWTDSDKDKETILDMLKWLPEITMKMDK